MGSLDFNFFCKTCSQSEEYRKENCFKRHKVRHYDSGDYITYKGTKANELSIIVEGSASTEIVFDTGLGYTTRHHTAPYPIGAIALFSEENCYRADIKATTPCRVISVKREDVEEQILMCRTFMRNFIGYVTNKIDIFSNHLSVLTHKSLKAKLAFYIFSISIDREFCFNMTLNALATYLCVERPSLSRAISELVTSEVITYTRGCGRIINVDELINRFHNPDYNTPSKKYQLIM